MSARPKVVLKPYYTPAEVAELLDYHPAHVRRILANGKLPSDKMPNGTRRVSHLSVMRWVAEHGSDMIHVLYNVDLV